MAKILQILFITLLFQTTFGQTVTIKGKITDEKDNSEMIGVNVKIKGTTNGMSTDENGNYEIKAPVGLVHLEATYVGYQVRNFDVISSKEGEEKVVNLKMTDLTREMNIVVVSSTKTEKKFGEETQSMEVLKGQNITQSAQTASEAINKVPGVNMMGKSISIRGGSGFADATSNRVMMLLNEVPMLSPENGSIRFDLLPVEAIDQMEITKGAASAVYGAQAMTGLINVRTINAQKDEVVNKLFLNTGLYQAYRDPSWTWFWKRSKLGKIPPVFGSLSHVYARKFGNVGLVNDVSLNLNQGFTAHNRSMIFRNYTKLKYTSAKIPGLTVGGDLNIFFQKADDFFLFKDYKDSITKYKMVDSTYIDPVFGPVTVQVKKYDRPPYYDSLVLFPAAVNEYKTFSLIVNPYITYYDEKDNKHGLKTSMYYVNNQSNTGDSSKSYKISGDYTFSKKIKKYDLEIITGISGMYRDIKSVTFHNRKSYNFATFLNVEKKFFKTLAITMGVRFEYNKLDTVSAKNQLDLISLMARKTVYAPIKPLFRFGLNWQATEGTFIRASFGQGYRFPDIAEMFVQTPRSGAYAVPNPKLRPESGWSAEIGIKQGVKISRWMFFADVSAYYSRYRDMIEFINVPKDSAGVPIPDGINIVAQAKNFTKAQIWGIEVSAIGTGKIFGVPLNFLIGYNYMNPRNLAPNPADPSSKYLNFRMAHSAKADAQTEYKGFILGATAVVITRMLRIDPNFNSINSIRNFMTDYNRAQCILDFRFGYNWKDKLSATFIMKNATNRNYGYRPGFVEPPTNYSLLLKYNLGKVIQHKKKEIGELSN